MMMIGLSPNLVPGLGDMVNMRVGMNLLLWTTEVGPSHRELLRQIRGVIGAVPGFVPGLERDNRDCPQD